MLKKLLSSCIAFAMLMSLSVSCAFAAVGDEIIVTTTDSGFSTNTPQSGGWDNPTGLVGYNGTATKYHEYISGADVETTRQAYVTWTPKITEAGRYDVYIWRVGHAGNHPKALLQVMSRTGLQESVMLQALSASDAGWYKVGNFDFAAGTDGYIRLGRYDNSQGAVRVNSVKLVKTDDAPTPSVELITPDSLSAVDTNTKIELKFSLAMNDAYMNSQYVTLTETESGTPVAVSYAVSGEAATNLSMTPDERLKAKTSYTVTVSGDVQSSAGTPMGETKSWNFTTDVIVYETVVVTTKDGAAHYTEEGGTWAESGLPGYNNMTSRYVGNKAGAKATFQTELSAGKYIVKFYRVVNAANSTAAPLSIYHAEGVENRLFNGTVGGVSGWVDYGTWKFNSGEAKVTIELDDPSKIIRTSAVMFQKIEDTEAPTAELISPDALTDIALDTNFVVQFSETMPEREILEGITLTEKEISEPVACTVTYNAATKTATVDPDVDLKPGVEYELALGDRVCDLAGNPVSGTKSWTIKTYPIHFSGFSLKDATGSDVTALTKGAALTASVTASNQSGASIRTVLLYGLYDANGVLEAANFSPKLLTDGTVDDLNTLSIILPDKDLTGYTLKIFLWESFDTLRPYDVGPIVVPNIRG